MKTETHIRNLKVPPHLIEALAKNERKQIKLWLITPTDKRDILLTMEVIPSETRKIVSLSGHNKTTYVENLSNYP